MLPVAKDRKVTQNASCKVSQVISKILLPLLENPPPSHVCFERSNHEHVADLLKNLEQACPAAMLERETFMDMMGSAFDICQWKTKL